MIWHNNYKNFYNINIAPIVPTLFQYIGKYITYFGGKQGHIFI